MRFRSCGVYTIACLAETNARILLASSMCLTAAGLQQSASTAVE